MKKAGIASLALYAEDRHSKAPTAEQILKAFHGHRRYRLFDSTGTEVMCFHDPVSTVGEQVLNLLGMDRSAYGLAPRNPGDPAVAQRLLRPARLAVSSVANSG